MIYICIYIRTYTIYILYMCIYTHILKINTFIYLVYNKLIYMKKKFAFKTIYHTSLLVVEQKQPIHFLNFFFLYFKFSTLNLVQFKNLVI